MTLAIGIGCVWFVPKEGFDVENEGLPDKDEYFERIKSNLEQIDNISNVVAKAPRINAILGFDESDEKENRYFPIFCGGSIAFDIFVPERIQSIYSFGGRILSEERFHVLIQYTN